MLGDCHFNADLVRNKNIRRRSLAVFVKNGDSISNSKRISDENRSDKANSIVSKRNGKSISVHTGKFRDQEARCTRHKSHHQCAVSNSLPVRRVSHEFLVHMIWGEVSGDFGEAADVALGDSLGKLNGITNFDRQEVHGIG